MYINITYVNGCQDRYESLFWMEDLSVLYELLSSRRWYGTRGRQRWGIVLKFLDEWEKPTDCAGFVSGSYQQLIWPTKESAITLNAPQFLYIKMQPHPTPPQSSPTKKCSPESISNREGGKENKNLHSVKNSCKYEHFRISVWEVFRN